MKVLIVDPDADRVPPLQQALAAVGAEVALAPSGSFALTMLEWNRQDVIVSRPVIDDMDAIELCSIVRADPATRDVRFVLVAGAGEIDTGRTAAAGVDLVLPTDMTAAMILTLVTMMRRERDRVRPVEPHPPAGSPLGESGATPPALPPAAPPAPPTDGAARALEPDSPPPTRPTDGAARVPDPVSPPPALPANGAARPAVPAPPAPAADGGHREEGRTLQGSLGVMRLDEVTRAVAAGGRTGRLIVALGGSGGLVVFDRGQPVHAEYREVAGETALVTMLTTAHREGAGRFCFIPGDLGAAGAPRTIERALTEVLTQVTAAIDAGAAASPAGER